MWVDRQGREEPLPRLPDGYMYPRLSPDGTRVALDIRDQGQDIWIWDLRRQTMTRVDVHPALDGLPVWSLMGDGWCGPPRDGQRSTSIGRRQMALERLNG